MSRRTDLNRSIAEALSPLLIPPLIAMVQSFTPLADVLFAIGGRFAVNSDQLTSVERITFRPDATDPRKRVVCGVDAVTTSSCGIERMMCAVVNDRIYLGGGQTGIDDWPVAVWMIDPFERSATGGREGGSGWRSGPTLSDACVDSSAVAIGSVIYLFGGCHAGEATRCVWKLDTAAAVDGSTTSGEGVSEWKILTARLPTAKGSCAACASADGRKIFVTGDGDAAPSVEIFDVATESFNSYVPLPADTPLGAATCYYRDAVWLIGGYRVVDTAIDGLFHRSHENVNDVRYWASAVATAEQKDGRWRGEWTNDSKLQAPRSRCCAAAVDGGALLVVIGGCVDGSGLGTIELYDADARVWVRQYAALQVARYNFALAHCH